MKQVLPLFSFVLFVSIFSFTGNQIIAQTINAEYERFHAFEAKYMQSGMALSPDLKLLAIATTQSYPLYIVDLASRKTLHTFDAGNWYAGSRITWSAKGTYLLMQQLFYLDFSKNKDREVNFEIVDANSGRSVLKLDRYHDVKISADEKSVFALSGNSVEVRSLPDGKILRSFSAPYSTNSIAISPDGKLLALSERPSDRFLAVDTQFQRNKKGLKFTKTYKQVVSFYNIADFSFVKTIGEYYDNIYRLDWTPDGKFLLCLNIPHLKATTATTGRQNFISVIDAAHLENTRTVFPSNSNYEPDFRMNHGGNLIGVVSWGKFPELRIHDFFTGEVLHRFEMSTRVLEGIDKLDFPSDGRVFIEFSPDDKAVFATFGNQMLKWVIPTEE